MQQSIDRAITDYQDGHLSLDELRRQIEDEVKTADGMRAIRSLLEAPNESLPRSVRDLLTGFSTPPGAATNLRLSAIGVGSVLRGRYRLVREIGRGGMGVVYLADGLVDLQPFAVKVLNPEFLQHPDAVRVFREEARKCLAMRHPNIVGVYPLECEGGQYYLPMEYLEGKTVRELLDQDFARGVPLEQVWPVVKGAGAALAFAHDHGVIHSDLKPSNIFVTTGGSPRVLDFGIARALRDRRYFDTESLGGMTAAYASCEMLARKPPDFRDDVYAFACVVYELLTGNHPFAGRTATEARTRRMAVAPVRALSQAQNAVLRRGLAFNCDDRIATIEEFLTVCGGGGAAAGAGDRRTAPSLELTLPEESGLRFCAVCGKELPRVARFCPGCGASTEAEAQATGSVKDELQIRGEYRRADAGEEEPRPSRKWFIALCATLVVAAVALGSLAVHLTRSTRGPPIESTRSVAAPGGGSATKVPSAGEASRPEPAAAVTPSITTEEKSASSSAGVGPPNSSVVSPGVAAPVGDSPDTEPAAISGSRVSHPVSDQTPAAAHNEDIEHPPIGRHLSPFKLAQDSPTVDEACPYPAAAQESGDTGTVVLLVYVAADGSPAKIAVESSSDSRLLDDAAVDCVEQNLRFVPKHIAGTAVGSWVRFKFKWSIGE